MRWWLSSPCSLSAIISKKSAEVNDLCAFLYQQPFPFPPIREIPLQQRVKARPVVHFLDMAQLMDHHKVNGLHGASHEIT